jgi:hopene-associated glycosyltransferase HpnB
MIPLAAVAAASFAVWILMVVRRGGFWRTDVRLSGVSMRPPDPPPKVVAVIPARDEAETIGAAVASLLIQNYPGLAAVIVVDDNSADGTAESARAVARHDDRLSVISCPSLPEGWSGKVWAQHQGIKAAVAAIPDADYFLLTDADVEHERDNLFKLVAKAESEGRDLVSLLVRQNTEGPWARLLIPAIVFFFQKLYPFNWINDPERPTAGAAGGCMLVYRQALEVVGGVERVRNNLIDDCALATVMQQNGSIWLGLSEHSLCLRRYGGLGDIWKMVARTSYEQLNHSTMAVFASTVGMALLYIAPPMCFVAGLLTGDGTATLMSFLALCLMMLAYMPTLGFYGESKWRVFLLPVAAILYMLMTLDSVRLALRGIGSQWKGRNYPPEGPVA